MHVGNVRLPNVFEKGIYSYCENAHLHIGDAMATLAVLQRIEQEAN